MHLGDTFFRQRPGLPLLEKHEAIIGLERFSQRLDALLHNREHKLARHRLESLQGLTGVEEVLLDLLHTPLLVMSNSPFWLTSNLSNSTLLRCWKFWSSRNRASG